MNRLFSKLAQTFKKQSLIGKLILIGIFLVIIMSSPIWGLLLLMLLLLSLPLLFGGIFALLICKSKSKNRVFKSIIVISIIGLSLFAEISWAKTILSGNPNQDVFKDTALVSDAFQENAETEETKPVTEEPLDEEGTITEEQPAENTQETEKKETPIVPQAPTYEYYDVVKVVDGDTIKINHNGTTESIRFIGIDTPETVHPSLPVQCFGVEASNKAKVLMQGKRVRLEMDPTQGDRDKYNRILAYIFLEDGTHVNYKMIREGYAFEYTYNLPYQYMDEFKEAERLAREEGAGLWSANSCSGVASPIVTEPDPTPVPTPEPTPIPNTSYTCDCSKTCSAMSSCEEAYYQLNNCGCSRRDGDDDGIPCEDICL